MKYKLLCISIIVVFNLNCSSEPEAQVTDSNTTYTLEQVLDQSFIPWGMEWLPTGEFLITDRAGDLWVMEDGVLRSEPVSGLPDVYASGQGGLLDLELHPDYENNGWIYISMSSSEGEGDGGNTKIIRAKLNGNELTDIEELYKGVPNTTRGVHFGSRLEFDDEGYLYFSIGDRGNRDVLPQDITKDGGKIYRIHDDGRIPSDNPFVNEAGAKTAIYSYGHRNPQGLAKNPNTGKIWEHEHGPRGGDELNIIEPGKNYGWPVISYGINYNGTSFAEDTVREGMENPINYWVPSIAPSGMDFVTSDKYPGWQGDLLIGSMKFSYLVRCDVEGDEIVNEEILFRDVGRVRNVRQGLDGYIYLAIDARGIFRVVPES